MTIEFENLGTGERRLADHRTFVSKGPHGDNQVIKDREAIILHQIEPDVRVLRGLEFVDAYPTGPDTVELRRMRTGPESSSEVIGTITREAINFANITDGEKKAVWHETRPEDYPPPPEGFTIVENP